jgi:hypothetical protein
MDTQNFVTLPREVVEQALTHIPATMLKETHLVREALRAALTEQVQPAQGEWHHCSPELLASGVDCATTQRRDCECEIGGSHDHFINARPQSNAEAAQGDSSCSEMMRKLGKPYPRTCKKCGPCTVQTKALLQSKEPAQGEREQIIRKLKRDVQWVPGKHYVTQLEEIMDEAAALLQSNAERVPLSDERIIELNDTACDKYMTQDARALEFARAIEAEIKKGQQ